MTSPTRWITNPMEIVEAIFSQRHDDPEWERKVLEYFKEKLDESDAMNLVPSLNEVPLHYLRPNSLVKFRCLVQDMFDPEFYMATYEHLDPTSESKVQNFGKYKDIVECGVEVGNSAILERQTFYCVPVPGESPWVKKARTAACNWSYLMPPMLQRHKRPLEDDLNTDSPPVGPGGQLAEFMDWTSGSGAKRLETDTSAPNGQQSQPCPSPVDLNFPLPGEAGPACLVKVYEDWERFKVNDMLEVYGIVSLDPRLSMNEENDAELIVDPLDSVETAEERRVHCPPASLVPRLHMICAHPLRHNNPLLPRALRAEAHTLTDNFLGDVVYARTQLLEYLTHVLLGDDLAAEYLLYNLISDVYARRDILPLGKFALNLTGCPANGPFTQFLYHALQGLVTAAFSIDMSLQNMNSLRLVPEKDYVANRLVSGVLQLAQNTFLFLDETAMEQGLLESTGVQNISTLALLINGQKVDYRFLYGSIEFPCNVNVLIASEVKSLLPSDCRVHLSPTESPPNLGDYMNALHAAVSPEKMKKFRTYITLIRSLHSDYSISDEIKKLVEHDFADMRRDHPEDMSAEDLVQLLNIARLLSISLGRNTLSQEQWMKAKHLEKLRKTRNMLQQHVPGH